MHVDEARIMSWSFSASKTFKKCARRWYLKAFVASARSADALRREAYVLSKLDSIYGWRGRLVDHVLSTELVPVLRQRRIPDSRRLVATARSLFDRQLAFARSHGIRERNFVASKVADDFAAFRSVEYGEPIDEELVLQAWSDVETALTNACQLDVLHELRGSTSLVAQRRLQFEIMGLGGERIHAHATPDLIAFRGSSPPLIVDWKVHTFAVGDYRLQLAVYALGITRCPPHRDFPPNTRLFAANEVRLIEAQLLTNTQRGYTLDESDVQEAESYIVETAELMELATTPIGADDFNSADLPAARDATLCERCPFERICWGNSEWRASRQMSFL